ncbi:MAG: response regulator, partial [Lachnospiraceae bacterium]|nr:response regulator [Lachnospiraceae bacterium]
AGDKASRVRAGLILFLLSQAWIYFGAVWSIAAMGRYRHSKRFLIPVTILSVYMSAIVLSGTESRQIFNLAKNAIFGRVWWIVEPHAGIPPQFGMQGYYVALFMEFLIMMAALIIYSKHTEKIFRPKYYVLMVCEVVYLLPEFGVYFAKWPPWIVGTCVNIACMVWYYFVNYYSTRKLRNWSLDSFANEMSDGFILYDEYDDPIYVNDPIRNTFSSELIEDFKDRSKLDEWLSHTRLIDKRYMREYVKSDGSKVYFRVKKTELGSEGISFGNIYILHDSTDSVVRLVAMEESNDELAKASQMKSDFLANMSHEIRTPMNAVIGMAELALRENPEPKVTDYLRQIQTSGRNLLNIINDILDFSKIEAGKMEIIDAPYEPLEEISDIANILMTRIGDKPIEFFADVDVNVPRILEGDAMRIRQILINLANNAIKFTSQGVVCIRVICEKKSDEEVLLHYHVIDTGTGIKEEDMGRLFRNFEQVDAKRNRAVEGTGLGLAISKSLCEAMGGSIGVRSTYGKGSDFYFTIPQKIVDPTLDIVVKDAENKHAFGINERGEMVEKFGEELNKLHVAWSIITSVDEYVPSGGKDYIFFEPKNYDSGMKEFLKKNPGVTGVILVGFDSDFSSSQDNLRIMRRPETTLNMLAILNDVDENAVEEGPTEYYQTDFTAPSARILIVDDNSVNIMIAEGLMESTKVQCTPALSGKEALELLKDNQYDLIFMDHMMPEMDGVEATHIIRDSVPNGKDVPIVALTANVMEGIREQFIKEGMNDFVPKPIDVKDLLDVLKRWLPAEKIFAKGEEEITSGMNASVSHDTGISTDSMRRGDKDEEAVVEYDCLDYEAAIKVMGQVDLYNKIVEKYYSSGTDRI